MSEENLEDVVKDTVVSLRRLADIWKEKALVAEARVLWHQESDLAWMEVVRAAAHLVKSVEHLPDVDKERSAVIQSMKAIRERYAVLDQGPSTTE